MRLSDCHLSCVLLGLGCSALLAVGCGSPIGENPVDTGVAVDAPEPEPTVDCEELRLGFDVPYTKVELTVVDGHHVFRRVPEEERVGIRLERDGETEQRFLKTIDALVNPLYLPPFEYTVHVRHRPTGLGAHPEIPLGEVTLGHTDAKRFDVDFFDLPVVELTLASFPESTRDAFPRYFYRDGLIPAGDSQFLAFAGSRVTLQRAGGGRRQLHVVEVGSEPLRLDFSKIQWTELSPLRPTHTMRCDLLPRICDPPVFNCNEGMGRLEARVLPRAGGYTVVRPVHRPELSFCFFEGDSSVLPVGTYEVAHAWLYDEEQPFPHASQLVEIREKERTLVELERSPVGTHEVRVFLHEAWTLGLNSIHVERNDGARATTLGNSAWFDLPAGEYTVSLTTETDATKTELGVFSVEPECTETR